MEAVNALFQRSLTLPTGAKSPTPRIVEDGTTSTILVYGAGGALIASIAAMAGTDGLGNSYPAGISASAGVISQSIFLLYNGTPAAGNLIMSMTSAAGTDTFGNNYVAGLGTYSAGVATYQLNPTTGSVQIGKSTGSHWFFDVPNTELTLYDRNNLLTADFQAAAADSILYWLFNNSLKFFSLSQGLMRLGSLSTAGTQPTIANQLDAAAIQIVPGTNPLLQILGLNNPSGNGSVYPTLELKSGNTNGAVPGQTSNPVVSLYGPSTSSTDVAVYKGAVYRGDLTGWQLPTVPANWTRTGFAAELGLQYRIDSMDNLVISGAVKYTGAGLAAGTNTTLFTLPAAYRPLAGTRRPTYQSTGNGVFGWAVVQSGGAVIVSNPTALVTNDVIEFEVTCPMGNLP